MKTITGQHVAARTRSRCRRAGRTRSARRRRCRRRAPPTASFIADEEGARPTGVASSSSAERELEPEAPGRRRASGTRRRSRRAQPGERRRSTTKPTRRRRARLAPIAHAAPRAQARTSARTAAAAGRRRRPPREITATPRGAGRRARRARSSASMPPIATSGSGAARARRRGERARGRAPRAAVAFDARAEDRPERDVVDGSRARAREPARACGSSGRRSSRSRAAAREPRGRQVVLAEVHAVGPEREREVGAVVHEKSAPARARAARGSRAPRRSASRSRACLRRSCTTRRRPRRRPRACSTGSQLPARVVVGEHVEAARGAPRRGRSRSRRVAGSVDAELGDLLAQRVAVDAEQRGGAELVAAGVREHELEQRPLDALEQRVVQVARRPRRARRRPRARTSVLEVAPRRAARGRRRRQEREVVGRQQSPLASTSARLIAFSSSRTLPGQACASSRSTRVGREHARPPCRARPRSARRSARRARGMSSRRSRSGGMCDRHHVQPVERSSRKRPSRTAASRSRCVAAMMRTSTCSAARAADRRHLAALQHAQQLRLELERHVADLVEEERAAARPREAARRARRSRR